MNDNLNNADEFNAFKLTDEDSDCVINYFSNEAEARAEYVLFDMDKKPVQLFACYDNGEDLTDWELIEANHATSFLY